ncbi:hypothetical protein Poli38472_000990 [Pythium oligandrum]|uniref:Hsp70-Hsp90 organising protein n=1 Tax=Pythium oligandrum TaxID=41045 RepID=A0A8K1CDE6_PYTOL|nr:hypothetical protein Poli38472_000990 [Pythium oligandrum]|eukprot:TMW60948.1 hypothetical protein Poli38472_000990 [Pythium oligandrum]
MAAEQAKDRGNRAFAAGNHRDAIASFSEAIALHERAAANGEVGGKLYVYYSNRSASYLKLGDGQNALKDADKCVALKRDWAKGYSRKGAALYHLNRLGEALRAYKDGLTIEPSNAALQEGLRSVQARMSAAATPPAATVSNKSLREFVAGSKAASFQTFQFLLCTLLLLNFVLYWVPFGIPSGAAFSMFFKIALFNSLSYLMFTHGVPKLQATYAQRLVMDPTTQSLFYCLVFWVSAPYGLAMVPVFLIEMVHFFSYLSNILIVLKLDNSPLVTLITTKALLPLTATIISDPSFPNLPTQSKWAKLYHRMPQVTANIEVAIGISIVFELLTPARNFLLVLLYWQLLRVRYMISPPLQEAFRHLNASILSLTSHPRCPAVVGQLYAKASKFAANTTDMSQQQQAAANGARPRCTIM